MTLLNISAIELIPQQPPFVFVDTLLEVEEDSFKAEYIVKPNTPLSDENYFTEAGIVEFVAQSMAAHTGYISEHKASMGLIGAVKNLAIHEVPKVGEVLRSEIKILNRVFNVTFVQAKVFIQDREIAHCELKVADPE